VSARAPAPEDFLSGRVGHVGPRRARLLRAADRVLDRRAGRGGRLARVLDRLADAVPRRRLLALCVYRPGSSQASAIAGELRAARHDVRLVLGSMGEAEAGLERETVATGLAGGKFENLNRLLEEAAATDYDWLLLVDDDVALPARFADRLLGLCEHFSLRLAQPAQTLASHAAWPVTRRRPGALARETNFVEIGPVTALSADVAEELTPFPELRYGWGLDLHWAALARERGWRLGILDALPVRHETAGVADAYDHDAAVDEARHFLASRPFLRSGEAGRTLATHRRL
jgi:hypothetical protein